MLVQHSSLTLLEKVIWRIYCKEDGCHVLSFACMDMSWICLWHQWTVCQFDYDLSLIRVYEMVPERHRPLRHQLQILFARSKLYSCDTNTSRYCGHPGCTQSQVRQGGDKTFRSPGFLPAVCLIKSHKSSTPPPEAPLVIPCPP